MRYLELLLYSKTPAVGNSVKSRNIEDLYITHTSDNVEYSSLTDIRKSQLIYLLVVCLCSQRMQFGPESVLDCQKASTRQTITHVLKTFVNSVFITVNECQLALGEGTDLEGRIWNNRICKQNSFTVQKRKVETNDDRMDK